MNTEKIRKPRCAWCGRRIEVVIVGEEAAERWRWRHLLTVAGIEAEEDHLADPK